MPVKLAEAASGLQYLHSMDIVHGNLKPVRPTVRFQRIPLTIFADKHPHRPRFPFSPHRLWTRPCHCRYLWLGAYQRLALLCLRHPIYLPGTGESLRFWSEEWEPNEEERRLRIWNGRVPREPACFTSGTTTETAFR